MADFVFGKNDTTSDGNYNLVANRCYVSSFVLSDAYPNITALLLYVQSAVGLANIRPVIYDNTYNPASDYTTNTPNNLVAIGEEKTGVSAGWNELLFSSGISLSAGTYHIGWVSDAMLNIRTEATGGTEYRSCYSTQDGYPAAASDPFGARDVSGQYVFPVYAAGELVWELDSDLPALRFTDYGAHGYEGDNGGWGVLSALEVEAQAGEFTMDMEANIPVIEIEAHAGGRVDATLPDLESDATMSSTGIRTGDYFNDYTLALPDLQITASFGERMSLDAKLPDLEGTGRTGSNVEGNLPELELTANCLVGQVATLDKKLPFPTLAASTGARLSKKLPLITINAEASTPTKLRLNKVLPTVGIEATISGATGSLDKIIAFPKITATGAQDVTGNLDAKIPTIKISADALSGSICTLDVTLPDLRIDAESNSAVISLDAYLPTVTTGVASGSDYGNASNTISGDRFDDTLLRYERWA